MRTELLKTNSFKEAHITITDLENKFLDEFKKGTSVSFSIFGTSDSQGITMEWEKEASKEADWFLAQITNNK